MQPYRHPGVGHNERKLGITLAPYWADAAPEYYSFFGQLPFDPRRNMSALECGVRSMGQPKTVPSAAHDTRLRNSAKGREITQSKHEHVLHTQSFDSLKKLNNSTHHLNGADWTLLYAVVVGCEVICTYGAKSLILLGPNKRRYLATRQDIEICMISLGVWLRGLATHDFCGWSRAQCRRLLHDMGREFGLGAGRACFPSLSAPLPMVVWTLKQHIFVRLDRVRAMP